MKGTRLNKLFLASAILLLTTGGLMAQGAMPSITTNQSGFAVGDRALVIGSNFSPGATVMLRITPPEGAGWSSTVMAGPDGRLSSEVGLSLEGPYRVEAVTANGDVAAMMILSASHPR